MSDAVEYMDAEIVYDTSAIKNTSAGRPELYAAYVKPNLDYIEEAISQGATEKSIYQKLGICHQAWIDYKEKYVEFRECIMRGRTSAGHLMLNKQFEKACGMKVTLKKQKTVASGGVVDVEEEMYIPPDTNAADFWGRHLMPGYKSPKTDISPILIQNNFQLPQLQAEIKQLDEELKALESHEPVVSQGMEE